MSPIARLVLLVGFLYSFHIYLCGILHIKELLCPVLALQHSFVIVPYALWPLWQLNANVTGNFYKLLMLGDSQKVPSLLLVVNLEINKQE